MQTAVLCLYLIRITILCSHTARYEQGYGLITTPNPATGVDFIPHSSETLLITGHFQMSTKAWIAIYPRLPSEETRHEPLKTPVTISDALSNTAFKDPTDVYC